MRQKAFTLIELLVVIAIIALLVSILMPSLARAKELAGDVKCAANMHSALLAVSMYNGDESSIGLQNYAPDCPYWGKGWEGDGLPHRTDPAMSLHLWYEGRGGMSYWRGYLIQGRYAQAEALGCNFRSWVGQNIWALGNGWGSLSNQLETNYLQDSLRLTPPFVWYGPTLYNTDNVNEYAGGNLDVPNWGYNYGDPNYRASWQGKAGPIFTCTQIVQQYNGVAKLFNPSHRQSWQRWENYSCKRLPYAENVGCSDSSVRFFKNSDVSDASKTFNPMTK